ncbi:sensor histidine kinase [Nonomuraea pusilla]|uniref:sensor histidine kinase n=1 Tax=Nonomuraea pusilla TaxID=46177 RepID=UPI0011605111|nr:ATP-binding protein [Nonomuraea pusilla]
MVRGEHEEHLPAADPLEVGLPGEAEPGAAPVPRGRAGTGVAERELNRAAERYAVWFRSAVVVPCAAFGILATPDGHTAATISMATLATGWCALRLAWTRNPALSRSWAAAALDAAVLVAVGLGQVVTGAGDPGGWVVALVSITAVTCPYEWPTRPLVGCGLGLLGIVAFVAGAYAHSRQPVPVAAAGLRLLLELTLSRLSYVLVRAQARSADRLTARVAARRRRAAVAAARRSGEREYLATLHDTASTTLLLVAVGARDGARGNRWVPERARHDLEELAKVPGSDDGRVELGPLLGTAARHPAVRVEVEAGDLPAVPATPALAIFHGVREALTNVERHAGVLEASLRAGLDVSGRVVVELRDRGRGFDPLRVAPHRRGLRGSIVERMARAGGRVLVGSRPGEGTTLTWTWPDDAGPDGTGADDADS